MTVNVTRLPIQLLPDPRRLWLRGLGSRIEAGRKLIPFDTGHALLRQLHATALAVSMCVCGMQIGGDAA